MKKLYILRGLPGSGKSTWTRDLMDSLDGQNYAVVCSADDFFTEPDGTYNFNPALLGRAHEECKLRAFKAMCADADVVVVDNTNSQKWEYELYVAMADAQGYDVVVHTVGEVDEAVIDLYMARGTHGVPRVAYEAMIKRWER